MAAVERLSMYARDREYAAAVMDIKVVGNAGPDIDNKVRKDLINMRTFHLEYDVCSRKGRLPAAFARGFGVQVAPFVMLRDPNFNEFEVAIAKKNGKVYFTDGWGVLKSFYGIVGGGWVTVVYSNRHLFLMELRNLHGEEVAYPVTNPPAKLMLQNQNAIDYRMSFVPYGPAGRFLPTTFHHTVEKVLTDSDATTGVLKLGWLGFCRDALPADKTDLTLIDYLGYTWKLMMDFAHDDQLSCVFSGEWQAVCNARKLVEGVKIKIGVTEEAGNKVLYLCGPQMMVLRTSVPPSKSIGRQGPSYRLDHYFWKN